MGERDIAILGRTGGKRENPEREPSPSQYSPPSEEDLRAEMDMDGGY
jgi:hypothetical protein